MMNRLTQLAAFVLLLGFATACGNDSTVRTSLPYTGEFGDIEKELMGKLILANDGDTITIDEGYFMFTRSLIMEGKNDIVIKGAGMDKTVLSFADQADGAEGIRVSNGRNITLMDFTVQDAKGDNLKANDVDGLNIINVKSEWTGTPNEKNGAYAIYPVMCQNVLIEGSIAIGASDAGIYVGQSTNVVVRKSKAFNNVAGIEIENTLNADVYQNESYDNTGGILVFDLPGLSQLGGGVRVFNNTVSDNNYPNFAPKGNIVASVPPGTGVMVLASRNVEIFSNTIRDHRTASVTIISYLFVEGMNEGQEQGSADNSLSAEAYMSSFRDDEKYNPYPSAIAIFDNKISNKYTLPSFKSDMGYLLFFKFWFSKPEILIDGIYDPAIVDASGKLPSEQAICIRNNAGGSFANLDAENDFKSISKDAAPHDCELRKLPEVVLVKGEVEESSETADQNEE